MTDPPAPPDEKAAKKIYWLAGCGCVLLLMVPVIGVVAAIAIPAFINYTKRSKTAEASVHLSELKRGLEERCRAGDDVSRYRAGPLPVVPSSSRSTVSWAADPAFAALHFSPAEPVYYSYSIGPSETEPGNIVIQARGDLDDDGVLSLFELSCSPSECYCTDQIYVENELE